MKIVNWRLHWHMKQFLIKMVSTFNFQLFQFSNFSFWPNFQFFNFSILKRPNLPSIHPTPLLAHTYPPHPTPFRFPPLHGVRGFHWIAGIEPNSSYLSPISEQFLTALWQNKIETFSRMQGWESECWGVLGLPLLENQKVTTFPFHVFDSYETHIQYFWDFIKPRLSIFRPSSSQIW